MCHFLACQVFQKCAKNGKTLPKFQKWVVNNRNDTKCLPVLSFCVQLQNFLFQNLSKLGSAFFGVPQNAKNGHFPISKRFEMKSFVIGVQKLRTGRRFVSFR